MRPAKPHGPRPKSAAPRRGDATRSPAKARPPQRPAGFEARQAAVDVLWRVMHRGRFLDDALRETYAEPDRPVLEPRDRAFVRMLATTALRRHGELNALIARHIERPLPEKRGRFSEIMLAAAAQLLFLKTPAHAAIDLAVEQCKADGNAQRFAKLANAVLRRVSEAGLTPLEGLDRVALDVPPWLMERWQAAYGADRAARIAGASLDEPALDLSVKENPAEWAARLGGVLLPAGTVRLENDGRIVGLDGFDDGAWWVQDAAAALPARLLAAKPGQSIADLCAAPGGKTAQLAAAGASVTAVDVSEKRLARVRENLDRLGLTAALVTADATSWQPEAPFDAVLLDAPCSATGTIRRHPDILHIRQERGLAKLTALQASLLDQAATALVRPGGVLVYCTCSLEPEEGEHQISAFLARHPNFTRVPATPGEIGGLVEAITADGDMRTLPCHRFPGLEAAGGLDGFFASRLRRGD